uniref:Uncharacterized protein n=1 Tax=Plectus sambesii TaxID=2011161 RepID=A0A914WG19_9BILA
MHNARIHRIVKLCKHTTYLAKDGWRRTQSTRVPISCSLNATQVRIYGLTEYGRAATPTTRPVVNCRKPLHFNSFSRTIKPTKTADGPRRTQAVVSVDRRFTDAWSIDERTTSTAISGRQCAGVTFKRHSGVRCKHKAKPKPEGEMVIRDWTVNGQKFRSRRGWGEEKQWTRSSDGGRRRRKRRRRQPERMGRQAVCAPASGEWQWQGRATVYYATRRQGLGLARLVRGGHPRPRRLTGSLRPTRERRQTPLTGATRRPGKQRRPPSPVPSHPPSAPPATPRPPSIRPPSSTTPAARRAYAAATDVDSRDCDEQRAAQAGDRLATYQRLKEPLPPPNPTAP